MEREGQHYHRIFHVHINCTSLILLILLNLQIRPFVHCWNSWFWKTWQHKPQRTSGGGGWQGHTKAGDVGRRLCFDQVVGQPSSLRFCRHKRNATKNLWNCCRKKNRQWNTILNLEESSLSKRTVLLFSGNTHQSRTRGNMPVYPEWSSVLRESQSEAAPSSRTTVITTELRFHTSW